MEVLTGSRASLSPVLLTPASRLALEAVSLTELAYLVARDHHAGALLLLVPEDEEAQRLVFELEQFGCRDVVRLAGDNQSPFAEVQSDTEAARSRLMWRRRMLRGEAPRVTVASAAAVQGTWMPEADFTGAGCEVSVGAEVDRDALAQALVRCGFLPVHQVEDEGTFSLRGGIIDVWLPEASEPQRIDLFGDEVASITGFDAATGRPTQKTSALFICPIREVIYSAERTERALVWLDGQRESTNIPTQKLRQLKEQIRQGDFFFGIEAIWPVFYDHSEAIFAALLASKPSVVAFDPDSISALWHRRDERAAAERDKGIARDRALPEVVAHLVPPATLEAALIAEASLVIGQIIASRQQRSRLRPQIKNPVEIALALETARQGGDSTPLGPLLKLIKSTEAGDGKLVLACGSLGQAQRMHELLLARRIDLSVEQHMPSAQQLLRPEGARLMLCTAQLGQGLVDEDASVTLLSAKELFGASRAPQAKARRRQASRAGLETLEGLLENDFVVHQDFGIGQYQGLKRLTLGGVDGDFVLVVYADGDRLYVPVYRLGALKRYHGSLEHVRLDKMGGPRWEKAKRRVRDAVLALAHTLLALQAQRKSHRGFALRPPEGLYEAFVASFAFEETPDQQKAIDATLRDLAAETPMDRLVCGDVGYGKTEVALRAAFVAAQAQRQVAILVPTTVLAEQHRRNFADRMAPWGVVVETISRFRSAKETKDILERVRRGAVDILIGTHRLLTGDIHFKDLGLMIVDEEQRFGVKHKEKLKQLRSSVHVLTLSATPIPRTLHMATMGLRDLSLIQTPPASRSAIRTEVMRVDFEVMQEAIRRELHRGGQVFVVYNRIEGLDALTDKVRQLVPEAAVDMAHGQMDGHSLERIMLDFVARKFQVLVCTAIIESGIDIPSVNTMIVHRADSFGLSQLYQLRGRIGRGKERAFAYLFLPDTPLIGKEALQRLSLLRRFSALGSGFEVASHDLEMRGAGDLLGADQSGHIAAVGFEMYNALLEEAVAKARGEGPRTDIEPEIKVPVSAVFAESYMPEPLDRLGYYQRMAQAETDEAVWDLLEEIKELFGPAPVEAYALCELMLLRRRLRALGVTALNAAWSIEVLKVSVSFSPEAPIDRVFVAGLCQREPQTYRLTAAGKLGLTLPAPPAAIDPLDNQPTTPDGTVLLPAIRRGLGALRVSLVEAR